MTDTKNVPANMDKNGVDNLSFGGMTPAEAGQRGRNTSGDNDGI